MLFWLFFQYGRQKHKILCFLVIDRKLEIFLNYKINEKTFKYFEQQACGILWKTIDFCNSYGPLKFV